MCSWKSLQEDTGERGTDLLVGGSASEKDSTKPNSNWCEHSLVSENVSVLVGVEGQFEDAVHHAALDGHLSILQLVLASKLPNGVTGHGSVQVAQEILHRRRLVVGGCAALECWRSRKPTPR